MLLSNFFDTNIMKNKISNYLKELSFSDNEIKVYLSLAELGEARASQVAKLADVPRTTAISILEKFSEQNYATTNVYKGIKTYWIESPNVLLDSLSNKMETAKKLSDALPDIYRLSGHFPSAKAFDTKRGIRNIIEKHLNSMKKGDIVYTIDTPAEGNYSKIFSEETESDLFSIKKRKGIITKTLVPFDSYASITKQKMERQNIMIRVMPEGVKFKGSLWLIKGTLFNFSGNPPFLVIIEHEAIVAGIKGIYEYLWKTSKDIQNLNK